MRNICFDMSEMHCYGSAFYDFLRLRKRLFVDTLNWDIPHNAVVEMDQYDNPLSHFSLVLQGDEIVGGARTTPLNAQWGQHTSMIQDALDGRIDGIPSDILAEDIDRSSTWECTRLAISDKLTTAEDRTRCLDLIVNGLATTASSRGARMLVSLSPPPLQRALRKLGHDVTRIGPIYRSDTDGRSYALLRMPAMTSTMASKRDLPPLRAVS